MVDACMNFSPTIIKKDEIKEICINMFNTITDKNVK